MSFLKSAKVQNYLGLLASVGIFALAFVHNPVALYVQSRLGALGWVLCGMVYLLFGAAYLYFLLRTVHERKYDTGVVYFVLALFPIALGFLDLLRAFQISK